MRLFKTHYRAAFLIETLISTVIISIIMLLFSLFLYNVLKTEIDFVDKIEASIWMDHTIDSLSNRPVEQIVDFELKRRNRKLLIKKTSIDSRLFLIHLIYEKNGKDSKDLKVIRYE